MLLDFGRCFIIEQVEESRNKVFGILKANPAFKYNIDYEKYEIIYLSIIVTDLNQEVKLDSATAILTVRILGNWSFKYLGSVDFNVLSNYV